MRRAGALLLRLSLALLAACSDNQPALPPAPVKQEKLTRFEFALDNVRYAISLPEQAGMREQHNSNSITFDARRAQRLQKTMALSTTPHRSAKALDRQHRLRNGSGRIVHYREDEDRTGGSGGAMATIEGRLEIGLYTLFLYCSDQSESSLFPDWCLDHLDTLELIPVSSGNG